MSDPAPFIGVLIPVEGDVTLVPVSRERSGLPALQELVGGYIEVVGDFTNGTSLYLNEEGKLHGLPYNHRATAICHHKRWIMANDVIVGPAVLLGSPDSEGEATDVPTFWLTHFGLDH